MSPRDRRPCVSRNDSRATSIVSTRTTSTPSSTGLPVCNSATANRHGFMRLRPPKLASRYGHESSYTGARPFRPRPGSAGRWSRETWQARNQPLAAVSGAAGILEIAGEVECEDVDREHARAFGAQGREGFLVRVVPVGGENNESVDAALLPGPQQIVHPAVQCLAAYRGVARVRPLGDGIDAVGNRRRPQNTEAGREVIGEAFDDIRVTAQRQVGSVLFTGAHGYQ